MRLFFAPRVRAAARRQVAPTPPGPLLATLVLAALLAGCASTPEKTPAPRPGPAPAWERDGLGGPPPADLARLPNAEPRIEPIRQGGPNKPYEVLGRDYVPQRDDQPLAERGLASWYGKKFHGRRTASGEIYNMYAMTAAHKTLPLPSYARVRNPRNGREIIVRVNDRGPFHAGRVIDLSYAAAVKLGVQNGVAPVEVERITHEEIRSGSWRRGGEEPVPPAAAAATAAITATTATTEATMEASVPPETEPAAAAPDIPASEAPAAPAPTSTAQGFWLQLGAFKQRDGAEQFQRRVSEELDWLGPQLAVFGEPSLFRLQAGPFGSRPEAQAAAERIRAAIRLVPVIVEKRR